MWWLIVVYRRKHPKLPKATLVLSPVVPVGKKHSFQADFDDSDTSSVADGDGKHFVKLSPGTLIPRHSHSAGGFPRPLPPPPPLSFTPVDVCGVLSICCASCWLMPSCLCMCVCVCFFFIVGCLQNGGHLVPVQSPSFVRRAISSGRDAGYGDRDRDSMFESTRSLSNISFPGTPTHRWSPANSPRGREPV